MRPTLRLCFATLLATALTLVLSQVPEASGAANEGGRVIVIGFDGADARTVEAMMDKGELPNLQRLRDSGTFAPMLPSNPAESPVSWASLNCGQNPAKTGVPGFVRRSFFGRNVPYPNFGHLITAEEAIESLDRPPLPVWCNPGVIAAAAFVGFLIVFAALLRLNFLMSMVFALILGGVGFWVGTKLDDDVPSRIPVFKNPLEATPFWEHAAKAGVECVVLDAAQSFGREPVAGARVLAGLGVPDARGSVNSFFVYTTDDLFFKRDGQSTPSAGVKYRVDERDGVIESHIFGPVNFCVVDSIQQELDAVTEKLDSSKIGYKESLELQGKQKEIEARLKEAKPGRNIDQGRVKVPLRIVRSADAAEVTIDGRAQTLSEGQWSDWYHLTFKLSSLIEVKAITRVKIVYLDDPYFELYVNTIEIDPAAPPFWQPISQPADYSKQLVKNVGAPFETVGWACMNLPFKDELIDAQSFMEDIEFTMKWREKLTFDALARGDWRMLMSCLSTPDRVQHMMYQYYDPTHPKYDAEAAARTMTYFGETITLADAIPANYRQVDRIVGRVMDEHVQPGDTLIVCADHGFQSFRREVHLNNWLIDNGFMHLKSGIEKSDADELRHYVDWSRTKAYSLGLGMIYLNLKGREGEGIVEAADAPGVMKEIQDAFLAGTDAATGERFGAAAYIVKEIHSGAYLDREADLLVTFNPGHRVSWMSTGGGFNATTDEAGDVVPGPTYVDNAKNWSGDHVSVDPSHVLGMFFINRKVKDPAGGYDLRHVAPTALAASGVSIPPEYDLPPLEFER
jgi:predicted AlkP superfamily phosphohydrolase/phosphomutase